MNDKRVEEYDIEENRKVQEKEKEKSKKDEEYRRYVEFFIETINKLIQSKKKVEDKIIGLNETLEDTNQKLKDLSKKEGIGEDTKEEISLLQKKKDDLEREIIEKTEKDLKNINNAIKDLSQNMIYDIYKIRSKEENIPKEFIKEEVEDFMDKRMEDNKEIGTEDVDELFKNIDKSVEYQKTYFSFVDKYSREVDTIINSVEDILVSINAIEEKLNNLSKEVNELYTKFNIYSSLKERKENLEEITKEKKEEKLMDFSKIDNVGTEKKKDKKEISEEKKNETEKDSKDEKEKKKEETSKKEESEQKKENKLIEEMKNELSDLAENNIEEEEIEINDEPFILFSDEGTEQKVKNKLSR